VINVLGISGSPRRGNSEYLLGLAMEAIRSRATELGQEVSIETTSVRGKKISGCVMCQGCMKDGECKIHDDFKEMQDQWLKADVIIYSVPVYHMGIPAQLKAFIDRLGNSMFGRYSKINGAQPSVMPKPLKTVGCISQGIHLFSGQEHTMTQIINHALISGCIPVTGNLWESYIGAGGWTANDENRDALKKQCEAGTEDSRVAASASRSLAVFAFELAIILRKGGRNCPDILQSDLYIPFRISLQ
jgi:multimeric flavodoxin WrbA